MKSYMVKKIFGPTIEGEGSLVGTPMVFVRLAGCNMWDGRMETRAASSCPFCDTQFRGGERMTSLEIAAELRQIRSLFPNVLWLSLTGGEPFLQLDTELMAAFSGWRVKVETNGTVRPKVSGWHHLVMSPKKPRAETVLHSCDDLKVLWPHPNPAICPSAYQDIIARHRWVQIITGDDGALIDPAGAHAEAIRLGWRVGIQIHKFIGVE